MVNSSKSLDLSLVLLAVCLFGLPGEATAAAHTSTYVFVPEQSKVVQTGGIAYVHWTYSIKGHFQLTVDPNAGTASFAHVDANATDDSPFKRTLDPNHVFNMTSLVGTVVDDATLRFTGKAADDSDILITLTLQGGSAHLIGQTTPPPNSADFFIFSLDAIAQLRKYGGGNGTAEDPYQIATAADLIALGDTPEDYDKHFILTADIDLAGHVFDKAVIAPDTNDREEWFQGTSFSGVFDGDSHTISHLTIKGSRFLGLFGLLGCAWMRPSTEVKNLGVVDVNILGIEDVGGLVGCGGVYYEGMPYGTVYQCYSTGSVRGTYCVGGLVGSNGGSVTQSYSTGEVSGDYSVGGLVGYNHGWIASSCCSGAVTADANCVGGLVGDNFGGITTSYSTGTVKGNNDVGGLVGYLIGSIDMSYSTGSVSGTFCVGGLVGSNGSWPWWAGCVNDCYSTGAVTGDGMVGGLVGSNFGGIATSYSTGTVRASDSSTGGLVGNNCLWDEALQREYCACVADCFWDIQASGQATSAGGTGRTTAEMKMASTFLEAGWDFVNIWGIGENQTYPYLRKYSAADINQDASVNFLDLAVLAEHWLEGFE